MRVQLGQTNTPPASSRIAWAAPMASPAIKEGLSLVPQCNVTLVEQMAAIAFDGGCVAVVPHGWPSENAMR
jgi:hypothetical protein